MLIADAYGVVREGLRALLVEAGAVVAGEAADGRDTLRLAMEVRPDLVLMDFALPGLSALDVMRELQRRTPAPPHTIILTSAIDKPDVIA